MSYLIEDIANYLQTQGRGTVGTNIFISYMPPDVDGMAVIDTGGMQPDKYIPTKDPTFQIFIRKSSYDEGKALLEAVRGDLHRKANITLGDTYFYFILALSEGGYLGMEEMGRDQNGKDIFSINFHCKTT